MTGNRKFALIVCAVAALIAKPVLAENFNVPSGDLKTALDAYESQAGVQLIYPAAAIKGAHTKGARGTLSADDALTHILNGTGFAMHRDPSGAIAIVRNAQAEEDIQPSFKDAAVSLPAASPSALETVTVTSSNIGGDVQNIPISITALSQEQLTATQTAGGPDLVKQVPNLTFTKTNFTGYSIQIRGIGTQAISVTTDPAVAVAF